MSIPSWCRLPEKLLERDDVVDRASASDGPVFLVGAAGVGTTVTGAAVAAKWLERGDVRRVACVRMDGCTTGPDIVLAIGLVFGLPMPGATPLVIEALGVPTAILLDDADLSPEAARWALEHLPARFVLTGRAVPPGMSVIPIDVRPLSPAAMAQIVNGGDVEAYEGLPVLARLPAVPRRNRPWAAADALPPGSEIIADLPMGRPTPDNDDDVLRVPAGYCLAIEGRVVLRRSIRELLGAKAEPSSESLAAALRDRLMDAHRIAADVDEPVEPGLALADLVFFRTAAWRVADPDLAAIAAAAAARLHLRFLLPAEALAIVRHNLTERPPAHGGAMGLLHWLEGDALLDQGEDAHVAHRAAAKALAESGAQRARSALARRCADRLAEAGDATGARNWLSEARAATSGFEDPIAWADTLRISGNLASQAGELVGAAVMYDEASGTLDRVDGSGRARAAVRLGHAALEAAAGEYVPAEEKLARAEREAGSDALLGASIAWRRAELLLRRGRRDEAVAVLETARRGYAKAGSLRGLALVHRLNGDAEALAGDRTAAMSAYRQAIALLVRRRDLAGIRRVLRRALVVEREGLPGPHVDELQEQLDLVEVLLRVR